MEKTLICNAYRLSCLKYWLEQIVKAEEKTVLVLFSCKVYLNTRLFPKCMFKAEVWAKETREHGKTAKLH